MRQVKADDTVKVYYTVKLDDGSLFDSTADGEPFVFTIGLGQSIRSFEDAVMDMSPGESKTIKVPAEQAYGPYNKELVTEVDRSTFPEDFDFEVGQHLQIPDETAGLIVVTVVNVSDKTVKLDKNHPLAGKDLTLEIQLLEIV